MEWVVEIDVNWWQPAADTRPKMGVSAQINAYDGLISLCWTF
jgi:hypothetical protein